MGGPTQPPQSRAPCDHGEDLLGVPRSSVGARAKEQTQLTRDDFQQWTNNCRAFRLQKRHAELVQQAQANGRKPEDELKAQGYADWPAFNKKSPKFSLWSSPSDLAELGTGFVLYFDLLRYLALLLFLMGLLQIPIMITYGGSSSVAWWFYRGKEIGRHWGKHYWGEETDKCECFGRNLGNTGPKGPDGKFQHVQYGTSCRAWDLEWCLDPATPFEEVGKWCCRSWCFASTICPESINKESPSLSARFYRGLVRTSAPCEQDVALLADRCAGLEDIAFRDEGYSSIGEETKDFIGMWYFTPGNLGPEKGMHDHILTMYLVCVVVLSLLIMMLGQHQLATSRKVDEDYVMPNDFAIMVKGLPQTATDEKEIIEFFRQNAVKDKTTEIVKVVIGWDNSDFRGKMQELQKARLQLQKLQTNAPKSCLGIPCPCCGRARVFEDEGALKARIQDIKKSLYEAAGSAVSRKLLSSGTVVVVFRHQRALRDCLKRWAGFHQWWSYREPGYCGFWTGEQLPYFEHGESATPVKLTVVRAANPGDIHWGELGHTSREKTTVWLMSWLAMLVLTTGGFFAVYGLNLLKGNLQDEYQADSASLKDVESYKNQLFSVAIATLITILNFMLRVFARIFGDKEYQDTFGDQEFSQGVKMTVAMLITASVLLYVSGGPSNWYRTGGLVSDVFYMLIVDSIVARACLAFDITYTMNYVFRRQLTQQKLDQFNATIQNTVPIKEKTLEQEEEIEELISSIDSFKQAWEPEEIDNPDRYARILTTFFASIFYAPLFPASVFIGMVGLLVQYVLDKYLLLRWYKRPRPQNNVQAMWSLTLLRSLAPFALSLGIFCFLVPSWGDRRQIMRYSIACLSISVVSALLPSWLLQNFCCCCCCRSSATDDPGWEDYYKAQYMWPKELKYHLDQPLYKQLNKADKEKNPEFLQPDQDHSIESKSLKAYFQAAVMARAADAGWCGSTPALGVSPGCACPSPPGLSKAMPAVDGILVADPMPGIGAVEAEEGIGAVEAEEVTCKWEFEVGSGWKTFADDCQSFIESRYKAFQANSSKAQVDVKTGDKTISVDFNKMTQRVTDGGKVRKIRRTEAAP